MPNSYSLTVQLDFNDHLHLLPFYMWDCLDKMIILCIWCISSKLIWLRLLIVTSKLFRMDRANDIFEWWSCDAIMTSRHEHTPRVIVRLIRGDYGDVIMGVIASQITSLSIIYSNAHSDADQGKHQSSASLAFVRGIHRRPVNFPHKWPATRKIFPSDDVIMEISSNTSTNVEFWCIVNFNKLLNNSRQWFHTLWLSRDVSVMGRRLTCFHGVKSFSARQVLIGMTTFHPKASKCDWVSFLASIVRETFVTLIIHTTLLSPIWCHW